ncbi:DNA-binding response regulator [Paenibacillus sp. 1011MAR3C5]|uniref:response regulator n=1 Tax=Paenibacillus sp. 1011MAR3C5 TaxID=1675787 RepID=UPI000E6CB694|nr:response regulator transcription factor [Paenibacillus sp. 1011MAR3C5]RJE86059.1 DNA-binding response regulator [Paenibacillus sp. 1011MAR3C5]
MSIRILLADDHKMVRRGLQVFLTSQKDMEIIGEASTGQELLEQAASLAPDIVLMDIHMPVMDGIEATRRLAESLPAVKVIVLTSFSDQDHALPAIRAGAKGYLLKDLEPEELANAVRRVHEGKVELHPDIAGQLMNQYIHLYQGNSAPFEADLPSQEPLTRRELDVLRLIAAGMSNRMIADALVITEKTVKTHVTHILSKLDLADRTQAALFAVRNGLDKEA